MIYNTVNLWFPAPTLNQHLIPSAINPVSSFPEEASQFYYFIYPLLYPIQTVILRIPYKGALCVTK